MHFFIVMWHYELQFECVFVLYRSHFYKLLAVLFGEWEVWLDVIWNLNVVVFDRGKVLFGPVFKYIDTVFSGQGQAHNIGTIVLLVISLRDSSILNQR